MRKNYIISGAIIGFIFSNLFIESKYLTAICLLSILIYAEVMVRDTVKMTEEKDKALGNRMVEGMKALTDLCRNAFDHIKTHKQSIDKINAKLGDYSGKLHQLDRRYNSVAQQRGGAESKGRPENAQRDTGTSQTSRTSPRRTDRSNERAHKVVPNTERKS